VQHTDILLRTSAVRSKYNDHTLKVLVAVLLRQDHFSSKTSMVPAWQFLQYVGKP
jgi:hypothetical protein